MPSNRRGPAMDPAIAAAEQRAREVRQKLAHQPSPTELLTPQELADAAPFYFVVREYVRQLKEARELAGMTLADVSARTGMAVEYLSRLETGAQTNPTWKTLGAYAKALGRRPQLELKPAHLVGVLELKIGPESRFVQDESRKSVSSLPPAATAAMAG